MTVTKGAGKIRALGKQRKQLRAIATRVQALMSARGRVERSAPPVRVHNLSKTWLGRLPGAAAGAAPGPLGRSKGKGYLEVDFRL